MVNVPFAASFFKKAHRGFDTSGFDKIYRQFDGETWYVQTIMNEVWASGEGLRSEYVFEDGLISSDYFV